MIVLTICINPLPSLPAKMYPGSSYWRQIIAQGIEIPQHVFAFGATFQLPKEITLIGTAPVDCFTGKNKA